MFLRRYSQHSSGSDTNCHSTDNLCHSARNPLSACSLRVPLIVTDLTIIVTEDFTMSHFCHNYEFVSPLFSTVCSLMQVVYRTPAQRLNEKLA